jgi:ATP-dependent Lon protease
MRRRVKEQLKQLDGMEFFHVKFSYIDNTTFEGHYISVLEQGGRKLIPDGLYNFRLVYATVRGNQG